MEIISQEWTPFKGVFFYPPNLINLLNLQRYGIESDSPLIKHVHKLYKYSKTLVLMAPCPASKTVDLKNIKKKTDWEIKQRDCRGQYFDPRTMVSVTRLWSNYDRLWWIADGRVIPKIDTSDISIVHCCSIANASDWYFCDTRVLTSNLGPVAT